MSGEILTFRTWLALTGADVVVSIQLPEGSDATIRTRTLRHLSQSIRWQAELAKMEIDDFEPDARQWTDRPDQPGRYWCADAHGNLYLADVRPDKDEAGEILRAGFYTYRMRDWPVGAKWYGPINAPPTLDPE